ncbi:MAG: kelch repeat-containing protein, partial [Caldilinea sp.]
DDRFFIDVDTYEAFADVQITPPINEGEFHVGEMDFNPGAPSDIVVVRGYYRWQVLTPLRQTIGRHAMVNHRGYQYVLGGETSGGATLDAVSLYDPARGAWIAVASLPTPLANLAATSLDDL